MTTKQCSCGKEIEKKYEKCYDCFKKEKPTSKDVKKRYSERNNNDGFTDLNKPITMPLWAAAGLAIAGALIGAILW